MKDLIKEFGPSSWSINNRTTIFVLTIVITLAGLMAFNGLPKENFPEITIPKIFVSTVYPGTSPANMENLVTKHIENQIKGIAGLKKITSNSYQDYSVITVEFNTDVNITTAKQKVKDAVDKAKSDLPTDLPSEPNVLDINLSELPIMYVNISGDFDLNRLKKYADLLKDKIEGMKEITRVELIGALDREIQVNVDMYKLQAAELSLGDIERAIGYENLTISGGDVRMDGLRRSISIKRSFKSVEELKGLIIKSQAGAPIYLRDIAEIKDGFEEQKSFARLGGKNVITLSVIKRSGENLIESSDKINAIVKDMQGSVFPKDLKVVITGDQSDKTRSTLHDLINTIVIGFILVTVILMFFMGATNAIFVAMSVPLSMFVAFLVMPWIGFTLNMIVLFSFLLALGIVVDDAIVVIENTHRIFENGKRSIVEAAKMAAGEVFLPVFSGTLTTLAPFIPLLAWKGIVGSFMHFLPVTLIITLLASLVVAYIINPVFAVSFMKPHNEADYKKRSWTKGVKVTTVLLAAFGLLFYVAHNPGMGNFSFFILGLYLMHHFWLIKVIHHFQEVAWPKVVASYSRLLTKAIKRPVLMLLGTVVLFVLSIVLMAVRQPKIVFFPKSDPNFVYVYLSLPVGTDQDYTNSVMKKLEQKVNDVLYPGGKPNPTISSVIANVTVGVTDPQDEDQGSYSNKGKITIAFVPFADRNGESTADYLNKVREAVKGVPGAEISVDQEQSGPPTAKPISIEVTGDDLEDLVHNSVHLKHYLDSLHIGGVEELKSDFQNNKPEIVFDINRERANREGVSIGQIGMEIRKAVFGLDKTSKFRDQDDEYPIQIRYKANQRNTIETIRNLKLVYRDMSMGGQIRNVPISSFVNVRYENTYGGIKRKNQKRIIMLSSNVLSGYKPNDVVTNIQKAIQKFRASEGIEIKMGGDQEDQKETASFLGGALLASFGLILIILVTQFNSISKPIIIITEIFFSIIGVFLGVSIFKMDMSIVMTGVGVIALAGIVVRNGILLVEFADLMMEQGMNAREAILEAGKTRMTPVLLTASATILGLIPLAVGLNIDFVSLFTKLNPEIFFGGDSVAFWGPLSWTMIFGLSFATFLTLVLVPAMYIIADNLKQRFKKRIAN